MLQEREAFEGFARAQMDMVISYGRRSSANNTTASNTHIGNQKELNSRCIDALAYGAKVVERIYSDPQSGFLPYSKNNIKRIARTIKAMPKGSKASIVVTNLSRLSREYKTVARLQMALRDYEVYLLFSDNAQVKPLVSGLDYKVMKLADVQERDIRKYKEEIKARVNPLQEERTKLAVDMINLGMSTREVYKICGIWQGAIRALQAKEPLRHRILKGAQGRLRKTKKVIDLYYSEYRQSSVREIAKQVGYSLRNVYYIIARHKEAMARLADIKARQALKDAQKSENNSAKVSSTSHKIDLKDVATALKEARKDDS